MINLWMNVGKMNNLSLKMIYNKNKLTKFETKVIRWYKKFKIVILQESIKSVNASQEF